MSEHEMTITLEGGTFSFAQLKAVCNADDGAACRNMPKCQCESWDLQRDEKGWFHTYEEYVTGDDTVTVKHRHDNPVDCNICEWLNADDPIECLTESVKSFAVANVPIKTDWTGDYYEWQPL